MKTQHTKFSSKRFKVKVEPEVEDDTGRRNEEAGDDVFHVRGSKSLADLRVAVEKYIVRPWEENKEEHEEVRRRRMKTLRQYSF